MLQSGLRGRIGNVKGGMMERREKWFNVKIMVRFGRYRCRGHGIRQNKMSVPLIKCLSVS